MNEEMKTVVTAISVPAHATIELLLALIGHLHDLQAIDKDVIATLLERRIELLAVEPQGAQLSELLRAQINWLGRLGNGHPPVPYTLN